MKKILLLLACCFFSSILLKAQTPPPGTKSMTLKVKENVQITFDLAVNSTNTLWVDPGDGSFITYNVNNSSWIGDQFITTKGDYLKFYGDITKFYCINQHENVVGIETSEMVNLTWLQLDGNNISEIDVSNNKLLAQLYFDYNKVSSFHIDQFPNLVRFYCRHNNMKSLLLNNTPSLYTVYCDGNLLSACGLDSLFITLSKEDALYEKNIFIQVSNPSYNYGTNPGVATCKTEIAYDKNWYVRDWSNQGMVSIYGDGTGCDIIIDVANESVNLKLFPNPSAGLLYAESHEMIKEVVIYNINGIIVKEISDLNTDIYAIDLNDISEGVYFVKIKTSKSERTEKLILKR